MPCKIGYETSEFHQVERDIQLYVCKYKFTLDNIITAFRISTNTSHMNYTQEAKRIDKSYVAKQTISLDYKILNIIDHKFFDLTKKERIFMKDACHNSIRENIYRDLHFMVGYNNLIFSNEGNSFEGRIYYNSGRKKTQEVRLNSNVFAKMDNLKGDNI